MADNEIDPRDCPVPPKDQMYTGHTIKEVPHGWEVTVFLRRLQRDTGGEPSNLYAMVSAWAHLTMWLLPAVDLAKMFLRMISGEEHIGIYNQETGETAEGKTPFDLYLEEIDGHSDNDSNED